MRLLLACVIFAGCFSPTEPKLVPKAPTCYAWRSSAVRDPQGDSIAYMLECVR